MNTRFILSVILVAVLATPAAAETRAPKLPWAQRVKNFMPKARTFLHPKHLVRNLTIAVLAPVRVSTTGDGSVVSTRWGFNKEGRAIPKEMVTTQADGTTVKRTLSYEEAHTGEKRLKAETVIQHGDPEEGARRVRTASLSDNTVTIEGSAPQAPEASERPAAALAPGMVSGRPGNPVEAAGAFISNEMTRRAADARARAQEDEARASVPIPPEESPARKPAKPMTLTRAYAQAVWASPTVHATGTTAFFFAFWNYLPWGFETNQAILAAGLTKLVTFPIVGSHAYKELKLKTTKKLVTQYQHLGDYLSERKAGWKSYRDRRKKGTSSDSD